METEQDKPVNREAWRRLLDDDGEPSALTDARIRAAARRALVPPTRTWWLPASLAASLLLAVLIVQWQFGDQPAVVTESDVVAPAVEAARSRQNSPSPPRAEERVVPQSAPANSAPAEVESKFVPAPRIDLPEMEEPASKREAAADESRETSRDAAAATPPTNVTAAPEQTRAERDAGLYGNLQKSAEPPRAPENWYAEIEKLRAAGRDEEADRELEKLEAAWPGWLEKNHPADR